MRPKKRKAKPDEHQKQEQRVQQPDMAIGIAQPKFLVEVSHAGTLGPLDLVPKYGREETFVLLGCQRIAADPSRFQVELVNQHEHTFNARAH